MDVLFNLISVHRNEKKGREERKEGGREGEREGKKEKRKEGQLEMRQKKDDLEIGRNELYGDLNLSWPITHQSIHQRYLARLRKTKNCNVPSTFYIYII